MLHTWPNQWAALILLWQMGADGAGGRPRRRAAVVEWRTATAARGAEAHTRRRPPGAPERAARRWEREPSSVISSRAERAHRMWKSRPADAGCGSLARPHRRWPHLLLWVAPTVVARPRVSQETNIVAHGSMKPHECWRKQKKSHGCCVLCDDRRGQERTPAKCCTGEGAAPPLRLLAPRTPRPHTAPASLR